ncbi:GlsB/YeaQ/YmgE family stress response membrane protein [Anthocerotibacter panamensis]|uniref:GlsB/YeaQ/YmgE family stress response membrane protein n=1 Tax=Anthocerotibacter panamensis TaxID=2857077 RepID=UPI001C40535B|nr:GlsB/YeaQ/YmgE family stress response membrane protein [Anthocerotibacter panamensis]
MNLLAWILLGLIAGAIAKAIYPGTQGGGILSTILLGVVGAFLGGTLGTFLQTGAVNFTAPSLSVSGILISILGAILAIFLYGLITRRTT